MINGELVVEWKKEKSTRNIVVENICYDFGRLKKESRQLLWVYMQPFCML